MELIIEEAVVELVVIEKVKLLNALLGLLVQQMLEQVYLLQFKVIQ